MKTTKALFVDKLLVRADRVVATLSVNPRVAYTNPTLAQYIQERYPHIAAHACINEKGDTFSAVIDHTPLPHLFEHMVVDILTHTSSQEDTVVTGTSEWLDRDTGTARVEVSYENDLQALAAFKEAEDVLNTIFHKMTTS